MDRLEPFTQVRSDGLIVVRRLSDTVARSQQKGVRLVDHFGGDDPGTVQQFKLLGDAGRRLVIGSDTDPLQRPRHSGNVGSPGSFPAQDLVDKRRLCFFVFFVVAVAMMIVESNVVGGQFEAS